MPSLWAEKAILRSVWRRRATAFPSTSPFPSTRRPWRRCAPPSMNLLASRASITASPSIRARYRSPRATAARPSTAPRWPVSSPRDFSARRPARSSSWRRPMRRTCASAPMRPPGSPTRFRRPSIGAAPSPSSRPSGRWGRRIWARGCAPGWKNGRRASPWFPTLTRPRRPRGCSGSFATRATPRRPRCRSTSTAARYGSAPARARAIPIPPMRRRRPKAPCSAVRRPAPMRLPSPSSGARLRPGPPSTKRSRWALSPRSPRSRPSTTTAPPRPIDVTTSIRRPTC